MTLDLSPLSASTKIALSAIAALAVLMLGAWIVWKLFFAEHQAQIAHDKAVIHATQAVGKAQSDAGAKASNTVAGAATKETIIHDTTRDHYVEITKQPGAGDPVPDAVYDAFARSVCMRASAAGLPDCQRLQKADPR